MNDWRPWCLNAVTRDLRSLAVRLQTQRHPDSVRRADSRHRNAQNTQRMTYCAWRLRAATHTCACAQARASPNTMANRSAINGQPAPSAHNRCILAHEIWLCALVRRLGCPPCVPLLSPHPTTSRKSNTLHEQVRHGWFSSIDALRTTSQEQDAYAQE